MAMSPVSNFLFVCFFLLNFPLHAQSAVGIAIPGRRKSGSLSNSSLTYCPISSISSIHEGKQRDGGWKKGEKKKGEKTHKIQSPNQLPLIVQLRIGRPVGKSLQSLPNLVICEDIKEAIADFPLSEQRDELSGEPALRLGWGALHEEHHWRGADQFSKAVVDVFRNAFSFSAGFSGGSVSSEA